MMPKLAFNGSLTASLDDNLIKIDCEGQNVKLTFTSLYGLRRFVQCYRSLSPTQTFFKELNLSYYIKDILIGESNHDLPATLLGKYVGLENTKFYPKQILKLFFIRKY